MARIRSIHPEACTSEKLAATSAEAERCYWRLQTHCDDEGRAEDHPRLIWAALFPLHEDVTPDDVDRWLAELDCAGLIVRYTIDGSRYLAVTQWHRFQHPQRPKTSKLPAPSCALPVHVRDDAATRITVPEPVDIPVSPGEGEGDGEGDGEGEGSLATATRPRDPLWDAIIECWGIDQAELTPSERGRLNKAVKELRTAAAFPAEIAPRRLALERRYPDASWTPIAVAGRWAEAGALRVHGAPPKPNEPRTHTGRTLDAEPHWDLDEHGNAIRP